MEEQFNRTTDAPIKLNVETITSWLNLVFDFIVLSLVVIIPLFFWNLTTEFYETPKFLILALLTGVLLVIWVVKCVLAGKLTIIKTPLDLPLLLLLIVFLISTFFTISRPTAIFGNLPRVSGGLAAFVTYVLFYLCLVSNLKQVHIVKQAINLLLGVGALLSVFSLLSYFGLNIIPLPWAASQNFTPTGSNFSTTAILALLLPFPLISLLQGKGLDLEGFLGNLTGKVSLSVILQKLILAAILTLFAITITLTGTLATYVAAITVIVLTLVTTPPASIQKNITFLVLPAVLAVILMFASFTPVGGSKNILYSKAQSFPREIQLPFTTSWKISVSAFRDSPFWGSGPSTYLSNFTTYKPVEFNNTKFWNVRFDTAFNEYLQILATLGAMGLIAFLLFTALFINVAFKSLTSLQGSLNISLAIAGITFFVLLLLHTSTLPLWIIGLLILALFMVTNKNLTRQLHFGVAAQGTKLYGPNGELNLQFDIFPVLFALIVTVATGSGLYQIGRFAIADYHHRQALVAVASGQGLNAYNSLVTAEKINPHIDLYRLDLAQTNFALANAIAAAKGPTEASPSGSLTDADKQNIQTLLSQAIAEGRTATALNPNNPTNWEVLGSIYRQISGVAQNAFAFSLDAYGRAIAKDPLNPNLRLTVGGIYYSVKNYDMAIRFFSDAVNIKPDLANGYFNLAVALRDKGDLIGAATSAERTVSLLDANTPDYKVAAELLTILKDQIASEAAKQQAEEAKQAGTGQTLTPPSQKSSALQEKSLPKVLDLPQPENIATPEAVKKQPQQ